MQARAGWGMHVGAAGAQPVVAQRPASAAGALLALQRSAGNQVVQRALRVQEPDRLLPGSPPRRVVDDVRQHISAIAPGATVSEAGEVGLPGDCSGLGRVGSTCVCELSSAKTKPWTIVVDDTRFPATSEENRNIFITSTRNELQFGSWGGGAQKGQRTSADTTRILAHEMCGHAHLMEQGTHCENAEDDFDGGRPNHDPTIARENAIAQEIGGPGAETRGSFSDPHHGESFARMTVSGYPSGATGVFSLSAEMRSRLDKVGALMKKVSAAKADIMGHADRTGSASVNERISLERARNIRGFLIGKGIGPSRFLVNVGKGFEECPPMPGGNPDCRRVDVFMFGHEAASEDHPSADATHTTPPPPECKVAKTAAGDAAAEEAVTTPVPEVVPAATSAPEDLFAAAF